MENKKLRISLPIIVEGKYDKNTLSQILDATIITTGGFSVFNSKEKQSLILRLAEKGGIIVLSDSDGGGHQIRRFLKGLLPADKIYNLYIPEIPGKEKRKTKASKAGLLGVEGMEREVIEKIFSPFANADSVLKKDVPDGKKMITKLDFFEDGLSGGEDSVRKRDELAKLFLLPSGMSAKALIEALNIISDYDGYKNALITLEKSAL
jgi:ribonuclease M5